MTYPMFGSTQLDKRVVQDNTVDPDQQAAEGMGELRKGWASGRLSTDANALAAEEVSARVNDPLRADTLRGQIGAIQQRQQMYAPAVDRVEKIDGVGSGLRWLAGQVGQGAASMADPIAASAAIGGASRAVGMIPLPFAKTVGRVGGLAATAVPFAMNQRQLTGEFVNDAVRDPELMARTSPTELRNTANIYGLGAGALDTVLPHIIGKQLTGAGLRQGLSSVGPGLKTLGGMAMEGTTELAQGKASQFARGLLNPNRDTSGDFSDDLNNFAGGAAGAGPFTAAGAYADAGYRRVGNTAERLGTAAGQTFDTLSESVGNGVDAAGKIISPLIDAAGERSNKLLGRGVKGAIDLASDDDGASTKALMGNLRDSAQGLIPTSKFHNTADETQVLRDEPADLAIVEDPDKLGAWLDDNEPKRQQLVISKLQTLAEGDDSDALALYEKIASEQDPALQRGQITEAATWLLAQAPVARAEVRAGKFGQVAGVLGNAMGKAGIAAGKAALGAGKALVAGVQQGMSKKNMQTDEAPTNEGFAQWRDRVYDVTGQKASEQALGEGASYVRAQEFGQRAELAASYAEDMAKRSTMRAPGTAKLARSMAFSLADMIESTEKMDVKSRVARLDRIVDDFSDIYKAKAPQVLQQLGAILGPNAGAAVTHMMGELEQRTAPGGAQRRGDVRAQLANDMVSLVGVGERSALMKQGVNLHEPAQAAHVLGLMEDYADGIGTEKGNSQRRGLDALLGKKSVDDILVMLNSLPEKDKVGSVVDDRSEIGKEILEPGDEDNSADGQASRFDQAAAEKTAAKGSGQKLYWSHSETTPRTDPFAPTKKISREEVAQLEMTGESASTRPKLTNKGQQLFGGKGDALEKKITDVKAQLAEDPEYPDHDNYRVEARSAYDIMKDANTQPAKMLQLFRDYAGTEDGSDVEVRQAGDDARFVIAQQMRLDENTKTRENNKKRLQAGDEPLPMPVHASFTNPALVAASDRFRARFKEMYLNDEFNDGQPSYGKATPESHKANLDAGRTKLLGIMRDELIPKAEAYFKSKFMVVGEQLSNRDPSKMDISELLTMNKAGTGLIERTRGVTKDGVFVKHPLDKQQDLMVDANLLMFKSTATKSGEVAIPAGKLVNWVRKQRGDDDTKNFSNASKDQAYLDDVLEGIAIMIGTGHVQGLPTMVDKFGRPDPFTADGAPSSLRLVSKTAGELQYGKQQRLAKAPKRRDAQAGPPRQITDEDDARYGFDEEGDKQEAVAADQQRQEDWFTPEDRAERDMVLDEKRFKPRGKMREQRASDTGGDLVTRPGLKDHYQEGRGSNNEEARGTSTRLRVDVSGQIANEAKIKIDPLTLLDRTDKSGYDSTELDFFPKRKDGQAPGDFDDQQFLTQQTNSRFEGGPEYKGTAASSAKFRAAQITEAFQNDPAKGQEMIKSRIRAAKRPVYAEKENSPAGKKFTVPGVEGKDQVVGGVHYIAPVAAFINFKNLADNNIDLAGPAITAIQSRVASILLNGEVTLPEMRKIAQLMIDKPITALNVKAELTRIVGGAQPKSQAIVPKAQPAPAAAPAAAAAPAPAPAAAKKSTMDDLISARAEFLRNPPDDYTPERAQSIINWSKNQIERLNDAIKKSTDIDETVRLEDMRVDLRALVSKGEELVYSDAELEKSLGPQGEVAAGLGKPLGAVSLAESGGRKLNAMALSTGTALSDTRSIMRSLGFRSAPEKFADVSAKLLTDPDINIASFVKGSAKALSHVLASEQYLPAIKEVLQRNAWSAERARVVAALVQSGMKRPDALVESYRVITEQALAGELAARTKAESSAFDALVQLVKDFVAKFKAMTHTQEFADVVRNQLNAVLAKAAAPAVLKTNFKRVTFQEAVDGDPQSAAVLAHMSKNPNVVITGSIVLAHTGSIYRNAANMLHDLDLLVKGSKSAAEAYLKSAFPGATQVYDFQTSNGKVDSFIVPPPGTSVADIKREGGTPGRGKVLGFTILRNGVEIGRTWNDADGEHKSGITGTLVDFFTNTNATAVSKIPFVVDGASYNMSAASAGSIFDAKLSMRRIKDTNDYLNYVPEVGSKLNAMVSATDDASFNQQAQGNGRIATQAEMDAAKAYADKLFGKGGVNLEFQKITGHSGEFIEATNTIVISTTAAAGTMGTLYHEAMHKFFAQYVRSNPQLQSVFENLVNDPKHLAKLKNLLSGYPAAQDQLTSGEERLAYTYQFWKAGLLQVDATAHTMLQKIGKFFRRITGMVRDSERALELFQAFDQGKMSEPSAAGKVIAGALSKGSGGMKARRQVDGMLQGLAALTVPASEILSNSVSPKARKLSTMLFTNPGKESDGKAGTGLMNARRNMSQQYINAANRVLAEMSEVDQAQVQKLLQSEVELDTISDPGHRASVATIREQLDQFHRYLVGTGMRIGKIDKYYPTVWSAGRLLDKKAEFIEMLVMNYAGEMSVVSPGVSTKLQGAPPSAYSPKAAAERIWQSLVDREGVDAHLPAGREDGVLSPFFASQEHRTLPWLRGKDKEAFLEKNMTLTLTRYFSQGAHAAEYFRRFGKGGTKLDDMLHGTKSWTAGNGRAAPTRLQDGIIHELEFAANEMQRRGEFKDKPAQDKWVSRQMRDISQSVGAMEGALGKDVSPNMRTFNSWMAVYQNIRLLPMSLFSSFVDPLALVARGAPMQAAYESFTYGIREVFRGWADAFKDMPPQRAKDEWRELAEHIGASEIAMFSHHVSDEYASAYMTSGAKNLNDKMFVLNGMGAWNRGSRIMATKWAVRFIEKHRDLPDPEHSARWLQELGLKADAIPMDDGKLVTNRDQLAALRGLTLRQADRQLQPIYAAINRWVEGAVLTPNAAQRPAWSSDPNYAALFHLKQFSYSFHQTILKRAANEFRHGNMAPVLALAAFVPTMIVSDIMKGLVQGGGSLPPYLAAMNAGDWVMHGVQRAGLAGVGTIGVDAGADWSSVGGPAFEQVVDGLRDGFGGKTLVKALPVNALYGQALAS